MLHKSLPKSLLFAAALFFIPCVASAHIQVEVENSSNTVNYRIYKNLSTLGVSEFCFIKSVQEDNNAEYMLRLRTQKGVLLANKATIEIDGKTYNINKRLNKKNPKVYSKIPVINFFDFSFYDIPQDVIEALKTAKTAHTEIVAHGFQKTAKLDMLSGFLAETKNIIENAKFETYREDLDHLTANYMPAEGIR